MIKHKTIFTSQARLAHHPTLSAIYSAALFTRHNAVYKYHFNRSIAFTLIAGLI